MIKRLLTGSACLVAMRLGGAAVTLLTQIIIAQNIGAEFLAEFLLMIAIANVCAVILPLGLQFVASFFAADYASKKQHGTLICFRNFAYFFIATLSLIGGIIYLVLNDLAVELLQQYNTRTVLLGLALAPAIAISFVNSGIFVGLRQPVLGLSPDILARPLIFFTTISFIVFCITAKASFDSLWFAVLGIWLISLIQAALLQYSLSKFSTKSNNSAELKRWFHYAGPWVLIGLISDFFVDLDLIFVAHFLTKNELAVFGVILKLLMLIGFAMSTIYTLVLPDLFESKNKNVSSDMLNKIRQASWLSAIIGCLVILFLSIVGHWMLSLFGTEFKAGFWPLIIMTVGLILRVVMGPASLVLSLYEMPFASLPILLLGLILMFNLNLLLLPTLGLMGAALSVTATLAFWSIGLWLITLRKTGLNISVFVKPKRFDGLF